MGIDAYATVDSIGFDDDDVAPKGAAARHQAAALGSADDNLGSWPLPGSPAARGAAAAVAAANDARWREQEPRPAAKPAAAAAGQYHHHHQPQHQQPAGPVPMARVAAAPVAMPAAAPRVPMYTPCALGPQSTRHPTGSPTHSAPAAFAAAAGRSPPASGSLSAPAPAAQQAEEQMLDGVQSLRGLRGSKLKERRGGISPSFTRMQGQLTTENEALRVVSTRVGSREPLTFRG
jgi:hypothetical protein